MKVEVLGGQREFKMLTNAFSEEKIAVLKAMIWNRMLNDGERPTKWLKTTAKGTKVNFEMVKTEEDYAAGIKDLEVYLQEINTKYGFDYSLTNKEGENE